MLVPCQFFRCAALHAECFGEYGLHLVHVLWCELAGLPRVMVHPVPYNMGVKVRLPCGFVIGRFVVFLVTVDEYLQGGDVLACGTTARSVATTPLSYRLCTRQHPP